MYVACAPSRGHVKCSLKKKKKDTFNIQKKNSFLYHQNREEFYFFLKKMFYAFRM